MRRNPSNRPLQITSIFFGFLMLVSTSLVTFPQKANAQFGGIVSDPLTEIETTLNITQLAVLNPIAWTVAKAALQSVVKSAVNSINKGSNGSPGFVTDLNQLLLSVGDTAANNFISQLSSNGSIKSPFQTAVASSVGNNYLQSTGSGGFFASNPYTLNKVSTNDTAFLNGDFSQGGLTAFMTAWSNPANNPLGASQLAAGALGSSVSNAQSTQKTEVTMGQGFLASRGNCPTTTTGGTTQTTTTGSSNTSLTSALTSLTSLSANSTCQSSPIQTPGSTIKAALDKSLGSGIDTLVSAHTFDEIINSLLGQLTSQILGSGGLSGASQPTTTTVPATATTATTTATVAGYFDQTDPSVTATNASLISSLSSTISNQITQIQQFQTNWTAIDTAALAANTALNSSICPGAQTTITTVVQPVLQQAATSLDQASSGISGLQSIQQNLTTAQNSTTDQTTTLSNVSTAYTNIQSTLPSPSDIAYASAQSLNSTTTPPTLYTQMNQLAASAQQCSIGAH